MEERPIRTGDMVRHLNPGRVDVRGRVVDIDRDCGQAQIDSHPDMWWNLHNLVRV